MKSKLWSSLGIISIVLVGLLWVRVNKDRELPSSPQDSPSPGSEASYSEPEPSKLAESHTEENHSENLNTTALENKPSQKLQLKDIPNGELLRQLSRLTPIALERALTKLSDPRIPHQDFNSLRVVSDGTLFYACDIPPAIARTTPSAAAASTLTADTSATDSKEVAAAASATPPVRHSRPGSSKIIYLDFTGATVSGTLWNTDYNGGAAFTTLPYSADGDYSSFSDVEQAVIIRVWERVSEDFRPFDVDVTTEAPASMGANVVHVVITRSTRGDGATNPEAASAGGVAFLDNFGSAYAAAYAPAFVYHNHTGEENGMAVAISHEAGHYIGDLHHDGIGSTEYYSGHGSGDTSWGPIMGGPYGKNVTQWSQGDYYDATNTAEDDLALLAAKLGYIPDDYGDTNSTAGALSISGNTLSASGVIGTTNEIDRFVFTVGASNLSFTVNPYRSASAPNGGNSDLLLQLLDSSGNEIASANPLDETAASLSTSVGAGTYYIRVSSVGMGSPHYNSPSGYTAYGSLGSYSLTGSSSAIVSGDAPTLSLHPISQTANAGDGVTFSINASGTAPFTYQWQKSPNGTTWTDLDDLGNYSGSQTTFLQLSNVAISGNQYRCVVSNPFGNTTSNHAILTVNGSTAGNRLRSQLVQEGQTASFTISTDGDGEKTYQWKHNGFTIPGATEATLTLSAVTSSDRGRYEVAVTDSEGITRAVAYLHVAVTGAAFRAWGTNDSGQINVPTGLSSIASFVAGSTHSLALTGDGNVVGWGNNFSGSATPPAGLSHVIDVAAGATHSLALLSNGTVLAWGSNSEGQITVPSGLSGVVAIAANRNHNIALKGDGSVVTWGKSINGQPNVDVPNTLSDVVAVSAGEEHFMALQADGSVAEWGRIWQGNIQMPSNLDNAVAIAAAGQYSMALRSTGEVVLWRNTDGDVPLDLSNVVGIAAGSGHSFALKGDRTVVAWSEEYPSSYGETTVPSGLKNVISIDGGQRYSVALYKSASGLPLLSNHPTSQTISVGGNASFTVAASSSSSLSYQWKREGINLVNGPNISGATGPTLSLSNIQISDEGRYTVVVSNSSGSVESSARLSVNNTPIFTARPLSRTAEVGDAVTFTSVVTGQGLTYQWKHNGQIIPGATNPSLNISSVTLRDRGRYEIIVTSSTNETAMSVFMFYPWSPNSWVEAWGVEDAQASIPSGLNDVITLATRGSSGHSLAVRSNGTVVAWGRNPFGQTDVPAGLSDVVSVAVGGTHSLALKSDGTVVGWGKNDNNQISIPNGLTDVIAITTNTRHNSLALCADGSLVAWGAIVNGIRLPSDLRDVVQVSAKGTDVAALKSDGSYAILETYISGSPPSDLETPTAFSIGGGGGYYILALKDDSTVRAWGYNPDGQSTVPTGLTDVIKVVAGSNSSLALKSDGQVVAWGKGGAAQSEVPVGLSGVFDLVSYDGLNLALVSNDFPPSISDHPQNLEVISNAVASFSTVAVGGSPLVYLWQRLPSGSSTWNYLADGGIYSGVATPRILISNADLAMNGDQFRCIVSNPEGSTTTATVMLTVLESAATTSIAAGSTHSLFTDGNGNLWGMGSNTVGQLGLDDYLGSSSGPNIPLLIANGVTAAFSKQAHSLYIKNDASLWGMGNNGNGQLGDGSQISRSSPVAIDTNVVSASVGQWHSIYLKTDGTMWGMGQNEHGELGDGTTTQRLSPVLITSNVLAISAGTAHTLILKTDGTLLSVGANNEGQLGNGNFSDQSTPIVIDTGVSSIAAGRYSSFYIKTDGTLWGMGANGAGQLGDGTTSRRAYPAQIATGVVAVSASDHTLFIKTDGTLWGMGYNSNGQLGVSSGSNQTLPIPITTGVMAVTTGGLHSMYIKTDGTLWSMGKGSNGQLGLGDFNNHSTPVEVSLDLEIAPSIRHQPSNSSVYLGDNASFTLVVDGNPLPSLQWQRLPHGSSIWNDLSDDSVYSGVTTSSLLITAPSVGMNGDQFRVVVSNSVGSVISSPKSLTLIVPEPAITSQPSDTYLLLGDSLSLSVGVNSPVTLTYQWRKNGTEISGATSATLTISSVQSSDEATYTVVVTNSAGSVTSDPATITIALPPTITTDPTNQTVYTGTTTTFSVSATSNAPLTYQWKKAGAPISGATAATYTIANAQTGDAGTYSVTVTNMAGSASSATATLTVNPASPPVIMEQPTDAIALVGQSTDFTAIATGTPAPSYQWQVKPAGLSQWGNLSDSAYFSGTTTSTITIASVSSGMNGDQFRCMVTNVAGEAFSEAALLTSGSGAVTKLSAGRYHSLFLASDGQLSATGHNASGQLGDGTTTNTTTLQSLTIPDRTIADLSAGADHSYILTTNRELWATGSNAFGQLGDSTFVNKSTPILIATDVAGMSAGNAHSAILKTDGTLWMVGRNNFGQLGNGTTTDASTPIQIASGVADVATGLRHTLFLKADGTLWAMGDLLRTGTVSGTATQIATGVRAISASGFPQSLDQNRRHALGARLQRQRPTGHR